MTTKREDKAISDLKLSAIQQLRAAYKKNARKPELTPFEKAMKESKTTKVPKKQVAKEEEEYAALLKLTKAKEDVEEIVSGIPKEFEEPEPEAKKKITEELLLGDFDDPDTLKEVLEELRIPNRIIQHIISGLEKVLANEIVTPKEKSAANIIVNVIYKLIEEWEEKNSKNPAVQDQIDGLLSVMHSILPVSFNGEDNGVSSVDTFSTDGSAVRRNLEGQLNAIAQEENEKEKVDSDSDDDGDDSFHTPQGTTSSVQNTTELPMPRLQKLATEYSVRLSKTVNGKTVAKTKEELTNDITQAIKNSHRDDLTIALNNSPHAQRNNVRLSQEQVRSMTPQEVNAVANKMDVDVSNIVRTPRRRTRTKRLVEGNGFSKSLYISKSKKFGSLDIDINGMKMKIHNNGVLKAEGNITPGLKKLLTQRYNPRYNYSEDDLKQYFRIVKMAGLNNHIANSRSGKGLLYRKYNTENDITNTEEKPIEEPKSKGKSNFVYLPSNKKELMNLLKVTIGEINAGNTNDDLVEKASEIASDQTTI